MKENPISLKRSLLAAMLPLGLLWFGGASTLGALLNLVAIPLITLWCLPCGLLGLLVVRQFVQGPSAPAGSQS